MADILFKGNPIHTNGNLPAIGTVAPPLRGVTNGLKEVGLDDFGGTLLLNIYPSVDTGICAMSARAFYERLNGRDGVTVLNVSADLPFAFKRFCAGEGMENATSVSVYRNPEVAQDWGVRMEAGPLKGLLSRCVVILDADRRVVYTEQVPEITTEPDYDAALAAL